MKNHFHIVSAVGLSVLLMITSLAGCSSKVSSSSASSGSASNKPVEITMLDAYTTSDMSVAPFRTAIDKFKKDNPNITLTEESLANASMQTKVQTLSAANQLPDVFEVKGQMAASFIANARLKQLDSYLNDDKAWKGNFKDGVFSNFTVNSKIYGIPLGVTNTCIFYNKTILAQCGYDQFPKDWAGLIDMVKVIKTKGYTPIALGDKEQYEAESIILSTLGNRFTGDAWYQGIREKSGSKFTDTDFVSALTALQQLANAGAFNSDVNSIDNNQQKMIYYNKKAAMTIDGTWAFSDFAKNCPSDVSAVTELAVIPPVPGGKGNAMTMTGGSGWALGVNAGLDASKNDAVAKLLKTLSNDEIGKALIETNNFSAVKASSFDKSKISPLTAKFIDFSSKYKFIPVYDHQLPSDVIGVMNSGLQEILINKIKPADLAAQIQAVYVKTP